VCLVLMPYAAIERPSIALGLLKSCLQQAKIKPAILYPNIQFSEEIGLDVYKIFSEYYIESFVGEWTFSGMLFPDFEPNHQEYFDLIASGFNRVRSALPNEDLREILWRVRQKANSFIDRVAHSVLDLNPRLVGCSSTFQQHCASLALLKRIRELNPEIITFMGGANCEGIMGTATLREFPQVDFILSGEGDDLFPDFCRKVLDQGRDIDHSTLSYGVITRENITSQMLTTITPRASVENLDRVPIPNYADYFQTLNTSKVAPYVKPGLPIETSRGCWWGQRHHCTFCGLNGSGINYRSKSPSRVLEEFAQLSQRYNLRKFQVVDNILDMEHIKTVLPDLAMVAEPYTIFYETKANLRREHLQLLKQAGVCSIQPGIESMHDSVLKLMNKGNTALMNVQLLKWAREQGMYVNWNMLAGFPEEMDDWYIEMAEWIPTTIHLQPPGGVSRIRYDRFSPYHERPEEWGLNLSPLPQYSYVYPFSQEVLFDLAYFFEDTKKLESQASKNENRPGLKMLQAQVSQWTRQWKLLWTTTFKAESLPTLSMKDNGTSLTIYDTRPCAIDRFFKLEGLAYWVYKACDRALTYRELMSILKKEAELNVSWDDIQPIVTELQKSKLMLEINGRLLSLAVKDPCLPFLPVSELPGGYIDIHKFRRDREQSKKVAKIEALPVCP
jgi:ribosomal peptide maturation radical SAM protein 1